MPAVCSTEFFVGRAVRPRFCARLRRDFVGDIEAGCVDEDEREVFIWGGGMSLLTIM